MNFAKKKLGIWEAAKLLDESHAPPLRVGYHSAKVTRSLASKKIFSDQVDTCGRRKKVLTPSHGISSLSHSTLATTTYKEIQIGKRKEKRDEPRGATTQLWGFLILYPKVIPLSWFVGICIRSTFLEVGLTQILANYETSIIICHAKIHGDHSSMIILLRAWVFTF